MTLKPRPRKTAPLTPAHVEPPPIPAHVQPPPPPGHNPGAAPGLAPLHVEPPPIPQAFAATAAAAAAAPATVRVTLARAPAGTRIIIDRVPIPQNRNWTKLDPGRHVLEVAVHGAAGDTATGAVQRNGAVIARNTATIPAGETEAYSQAGVPFDV